MPRGFWRTTGALDLRVKRNLPAAYFWNQKTTAVTITPMIPIAAAKLWLPPDSPRYWL